MNLKIQNIASFILVILVLFCFLIPHRGLSQKKINPEHYGGRDTDSVPVYHYQIIRNRPDSVAKLTFEFDPWFALGGGVGVGLNAFEISARDDYSKKICFYGNLIASFDQSTDGINSYPSEFQPQGIFELGGIYFFSNQIEEKEQTSFFETPNHLLLKTKDKSNITRKFGLDYSLNLISTGISAYLIDFIGYDVDDPTKAKINLSDTKYNRNAFSPQNVDNINTFCTIGYVAIGLETERIKDLAVEVEKSKKEGISNKVRFYLDALFSPYVYYANVLIPNNYPLAGEVINVNLYTKREYFGARAGWDFCSLRKLGLSAGAEIGHIPNASFYVIAKIGIALSSKFTPSDNYDSYN